MNGVNTMLASRPPLGWNSWNTFGEHISDALIREMADFMVDQGWLAAGYNYLVIDDCWSLRDRDENGLLVPDPAKFPHGMKDLADYVHSKGLKFGMYSCAGVMTCAGYPSSYDHEFVDAQTFASWGVDFLKYDFCNFPESGDCRNRYQTMAMALKASGRDILFSACNWGRHDPWKWMRSRGAHMYRSTGDIMDNYVSFTDIFKSQLDNLCMSGTDCFNDMDMLTVGMCGKGNVGFGKVCTYEEYRMQFALWCLCGVPLMMGADLRSLSRNTSRSCRIKTCFALIRTRNAVRLSLSAAVLSLLPIRNRKRASSPGVNSRILLSPCSVICPAVSFPWPSSTFPKQKPAYIVNWWILAFRFLPELPLKFAMLLQVKTLAGKLITSTRLFQAMI